MRRASMHSRGWLLLAASFLGCAGAATERASTPAASDPPAASAVSPAPSAPAPPVRVSVQVAPEPLAIAFVIDRSGSMHGVPMDQTKSATVRAIQDLNVSDQVSVVAFDSGPQLVVPLQSADSPAIADLVSAIEVGGGTEIYGPLKMAHEVLGASKPKRRLIILLTDGQVPADGIEELVTGMSQDGIVLTTVGLGHSVDAAFLKRIAELGRGHTFAVSDPTELAGVFQKEISRFRAGQR